MSKTYTTGELAKLAGVSVRTVQYYDKRGILTPSELTEGGRRIYTVADSERLQVICFLRDLDFSIEQIKRVLSEDNANQVLELLLQAHIKELKAQVADKREKLDRAVNLLDHVKNQNDQSLEYLTDISITMKNHISWRHLHRRMWLTTISAVLIYVLLLLWATSQTMSQGLQIFIIVLAVTFVIFMIGSAYHYSRQVAYLCPNCHTVFQPSYKEFSLAPHTPKTRKLTCPHCHQKSYCLETVEDKKLR